MDWKDLKIDKLPEDMDTRVKNIEDSVERIEKALLNIFGDHVLIYGKFRLSTDTGNIPCQKAEIYSPEVE